MCWAKWLEVIIPCVFRQRNGVCAICTVATDTLARKLTVGTAGASGFAGVELSPLG